MIYEISPHALRHFSAHWILGGRLARNARFPDGLELASHAPFSLRLVVDPDASDNGRTRQQVLQRIRAERAAAASELRTLFKASLLGHPVLIEPGAAYAQSRVLSRNDRMASAHTLAAALEECARARALRGAAPFRLVVFGYGMKLPAQEFWESTLWPAHLSMVHDPNVGLIEATRRWDSKTIDWGVTWKSNQIVVSWTHGAVALLAPKLCH